jgi:ABC-type Fe3+ transport system permease subunit
MIALKIIRILLIIVASILILSQGFFTIQFLIKGLSSENFLLPGVLIAIGFLFLFLAARINKRIKRRKDLQLIKSLPE